MKYLLAHENRSLLSHFAWSRTLVAFDFDGTLAPIIEDPSSAQMTARTKRLLEAVSARYPCAVISGRARADVQRRLSGMKVAEIIGNHGLEPSPTTAQCARAVEAWRPQLETLVRTLPGVVLEDKRYSVALHYRHSRHKKRARAAIAAAAAALGDVRLIAGKQVVNIVPLGAPHKGLALERVREELRCDTAIYVGDDETDEDVFALAEPRRLLSIRVGVRKASAANFFIRGQGEIDRLLEVLCQLRETPIARERAARRAPPLPEVFEWMRLIWGVNRGLELLSRRLHSTQGITGPQRFALRIVGRFPGITAAHLSKILHLDRSTMSQLLASLSARRLVSRRVDARDRRRILLTLTEKGRTLDAPIDDTLEAAVTHVLQANKRDDVEHALFVLSGLAERLCHNAVVVASDRKGWKREK